MPWPPWPCSKHPRSRRVPGRQWSKQGPVIGKWPPSWGKTKNGGFKQKRLGYVVATCSNSRMDRKVRHLEIRGFFWGKTWEIMMCHMPETMFYLFWPHFSYEKVVDKWRSTSNKRLGKLYTSSRYSTLKHARLPTYTLSCTHLVHWSLHVSIS